MRISLLLSLLVAVGCGDDSSMVMDAGPIGVDASTDGGPDGVDAGATDAGSLDSGSSDAGPSDSGTSDAGSASIEFTTPPIDPGVPVRFATVPYGEHPKQLMDVWLPESDVPTSVVVFYHGGGFVGGSRSSAHAGAAAMLRAVLGAGIAWVGIDYRFVTDSMSERGVEDSLADSRRGLQFMRFHAAELNIDPEHVGLTGGSAGAGTSLWLALHDDMANPESDDPIERVSTRVSTAMVWETQATYDVVRWPTDVFSPTYPLTPEELVSDVSIAFQVVAFYGLPFGLASDPDQLLMELNTPEFVELRADLDMLAWMSADDPPLYLLSEGSDVAPDARGFDILHHPLHAMAVREAAAEVGVTVEANVPAFDVSTEVGNIGFLLENL
ncbi:MAG: alpha/beta hydrolase [Polyangiales bacterium]